MPNWVYNSLVVSGDTLELEKFRNHLNQPFTKHFPEHKWNEETQTFDEFPSQQVYSNPVFAFWNVIKPTDLEAYYGESYKHDSTNLIESINKGFEVGMDWYNWNVRNWGTKWDVATSDDNQYSDTTLEVTEEGALMYHFNTAWSPVEQVISKLSEMYPNLSFDYEFEEEQGWGGSQLWENGEIVSQDSYDIPSSHADFKSHPFRECECEYNDDPAWWYKDCPVDTEKYEWDNNSSEWVEKEGAEA